MGPDALLRAAAEKLDHRRPVAEVRLGGGFPAEAVNSTMLTLSLDDDDGSCQCLQSHLKWLKLYCNCFRSTGLLSSCELNDCFYC